MREAFCQRPRLQLDVYDDEPLDFWTDPSSWPRRWAAMPYSQYPSGKDGLMLQEHRGWHLYRVLVIQSDTFAQMVWYLEMRIGQELAKKYDQQRVPCRYFGLRCTRLVKAPRKISGAKP